MDNQILEFDVSSATVALATITLHCKAARIAKTLSFKTKDGALLVIAAGDARIDNTKFTAIFHCRPSMLSPNEVFNKISYNVGGVCPFAVSIYLDESLTRFETAFPAYGSSNSAIELTMGQLEKYAHARKWGDGCKDRQTT